jgi:hypothetical protein
LDRVFLKKIKIWDHIRFVEDTDALTYDQLRQSMRSIDFWPTRTLKVRYDGLQNICFVRGVKILAVSTVLSVWEAGHDSFCQH